MASFAACRPLIINGIPELAARGDLADRAIIIRLAAFEGRLSERDWQREVENALPSALTALFNALALARQRLSEVPTPNFRMADFARLIVAAEPALPWRSGAFLSAYAANRQAALASVVESDLVASLIVDFAKEHISGWFGLTSALFVLLSERVSIEAKKSGDWPGNARWFSERLRRSKPALRSLGIHISERRVAAGVEITLTNTVSTAAPATAASSDVLNGNACL